MSRKTGVIESYKKSVLKKSGAGAKMVGSTPLEKLSSLQKGIIEVAGLPTKETIGI